MTSEVWTSFKEYMPGNEETTTVEQRGETHKSISAAVPGPRVSTIDNAKEAPSTLKWECN